MTLEEITAEPISSVSELIDLHEALEPEFPVVTRPRWAFRGQPRDYGTLVPSFQRQFTRQSFGTAEVIEHRLIKAFRKHYVDLDDRSPFMPLPDRLGEGFDLRCLSVMQHYEIPTRLLDWTSNFWTGVYFACASEPDNRAELWYYERSLFDDQLRDDPSLRSLLDTSAAPEPEPALLSRRADDFIVELDVQITPRMQEQFAHHTVSANVFSDHAPLLMELSQTVDGDVNSRPALRRILIDGSCKSKVIQFLAEHKNITASTVFPDVVGLGRFLRWQFESLRTMLL